MTSTPASQRSEKLIFAPSNGAQNTPAEQYLKGALSSKDLSPSPFTQFNSWFTTASTNTPPVRQPETVTLSTASLPSGRVSSRIVYLKELDETGWVIYSNFGTSNKSKDLKSNKWVSLCFWWPEMERQIRVEGTVERLSSEESQVYFDVRGRGSRIGAWASRQSQVIESREVLENWVKEEEKKWEGKEQITVPSFWGGLRVRPTRVEFWQGRQSRLHDRFQYRKVDPKGEDVSDGSVEGEWRVERLSP